MNSAPHPQFDVLGVKVHALSLADAVRWVAQARFGSPSGYVCCCNAHSIVESRDNPTLRAAINGADLATPDGMPLVWLGRLHGNKNITRVYGPDLMLAVCDDGRVAGLSHYFYGGEKGVAEDLARALSLRFPGLKVAGFSTPPFQEHTEAEFEAFRAEIARVKPDLLWIGLGAPKQELFMARHAASLKAGLLLGVGAAFDFHSGRRAQAPGWMQRSGLEWLFRLCSEPRRLGWRYLSTTPRFAALALWQLLLRR